MLPQGHESCTWGNCGRDGVIRINWRLIKAPLAALGYVVAHEVCHLPTSRVTLDAPLTTLAALGYTDPSGGCRVEIFPWSVEIVPNLVEGGRAAVLKLGSLRESSKPFTTKENRREENDITF